MGKKADQLKDGIEDITQCQITFAIKTLGLERFFELVQLQVLDLSSEDIGLKHKVSYRFLDDIDNHIEYILGIFQEIGIYLVEDE